MNARRIDFGRPRRRRPGAVLAAAAVPVAFGALAAAGQAPLGFWWLALPALAGVTWQVTAAPEPRAAIWRGWAAGAGYFAAAMFWIVDPFFVAPAQDAWMAPFALILMAGGLALFWAAAAALAWLVGGDRRGRALGFALGLAAAGLARTYVFTGLPWALIGHIWVGSWAAQVDAITGPIGLSLLAGLIAAGPVGFGWLPGLLFSAAFLGAAMGYGGWRLAQPMPPDQAEIVRLIQPNAAQSLKWRPDMASLFFERLLKQTALPGHPALVVWPETSVPFLLNRPGDGLRLIAEAAHGAPVALGIQRTEGLRAYNSLALLDAQGEVTDVYDKHHLVPFGEYVPFGDLFWRLTGNDAFAPSQGYGYSPGPGPRVLDFGPLGQVLPLICYEAIFPQDLRVALRPSWILQITDDGWFGTLSGPYQHLAQVRLRAIEEGLPILRDANTGVTAVIDARGRVLKSLPLDTEGVIDTPIPGALPATPYSRTGDWPMLALLGLIGAALLRRRLRG